MPPPLSTSMSWPAELTDISTGFGVTVGHGPGHPGAMNSVPPTLYSKGVIGPTGAESSAANRYGPTESKAIPPGFTPYTNGFGRGTGARIPPARIWKPSTAAFPSVKPSSFLLRSCCVNPDMDTNKQNTTASLFNRASLLDNDRIR